MSLLSTERNLLVRAACFAWLALMAVPLAAYESQIRDESRYLAGQIAERGKTAVAVIDFTDLDGAVTHLGRFLAEELSVALATDARSFRVVDRNHIRSLLKEHKMAADGLIDPQTARELGRIAGVDTLITASITPLGDSVRLSIKVLDSESAQVIASSSCNIAKTQAIDSLLRRGVAISSGSSLASGPTPSQLSGSSVEKERIVFTLQKCQRRSGTVTCFLTLLNNGQDRNVTLRKGSTRVIDAFGNEIYTNQFRLGSSSASMFTNRVVVRGVPMSASVDFEGVSFELRRLALVEFDFSNFTVQFKDVPIS